MPVPKLEDLLVLLPGVVVGVLLLLVGSLLWRSSGRGGRRASIFEVFGTVLVLAAVPVGAIVTWVRTHASMPAFGGDASERALLGTALAAIAIAPSVAVRRPSLAFIARVLAGVLVILLVLRSSITRAPDAAGHLGLGAALLIGVAAVAVAQMVALGGQAQRSNSTSRFSSVGATVALALAVGAAGQLAPLLGSAPPGELLGTAAVVLGAACPLGLPGGPCGEPSEQVLFAGAFFLVACGLVAYFYAAEPLPAEVAILTLAAAAAGVVTRLRFLRTRPRLRFVAPIVLACLFAGLAVGRVANDVAAQAADDPYSDFK